MVPGSRGLALEGVCRCFFWVGCWFSTLYLTLYMALASRLSSLRVNPHVGPYPWTALSLGPYLWYCFLPQLEWAIYLPQLFGRLLFLPCLHNYSCSLIVIKMFSPPRITFLITISLFYGSHETIIMFGHWVWMWESRGLGFPKSRPNPNFMPQLLTIWWILVDSPLDAVMRPGVWQHPTYSAYRTY